jgi:hypothetical protein
MRILIANLKHLYRRRGLWLAYAMLGFFVLLSIMIPLKDLDRPAAGQGQFIGLVVLAFLVGMLAAVQQKEILTRPFAFCLPGHRQTIKWFLFCVGVPANLAGSTLFLYYPRVPLGSMPLVQCSAFSAGMIFYLCGTWWALRSRSPTIWTSLLLLVFAGGLSLNLHVLLEGMIVNYPLLVIVLGLLCSIVVWVRLSDEDLARRNCLRPWIGFADIFDREKLRRFQGANAGADLAKRLKDHPRPWVERFFLDRMDRRGPFSTTRFVWGGLYTSFGILLSQWKNIFLVAFSLAIFLGYAGPRLWIILAFMPMMPLSQSRPILYSTRLTAGGRDERFTSTLATVAVGSAFLALFIAVVSIFSILLATVLPPIHCRGLTLSYRIVGLGAFCIPLVVTPLMYLICLLFYRRPALMTVALMTALYVLMFISLERREPEAAIAQPQTVVAFGVLSWIAFIWVAHHIAMHRNLST